MERETIIEKIAEIPVSELGKISADHEIWEGYDGRAHFKITRHMLPSREDLQFLSLSVSGVPTERQRLIGEFTDVLGESVEQTVNDGIGHIDFVAWLVP